MGVVQVPESSMGMPQGPHAGTDLSPSFRTGMSLPSRVVTESISAICFKDRGWPRTRLRGGPSGASAAQGRQPRHTATPATVTAASVGGRGATGTRW